jgi:hypothetical protein
MSGALSSGGPVRGRQLGTRVSPDQLLAVCSALKVKVVVVLAPW